MKIVELRRFGLTFLSEKKLQQGFKPAMFDSDTIILTVRSSTHHHVSQMLRTI